jgi:hypothetical protein
VRSFRAQNGLPDVNRPGRKGDDNDAPTEEEITSYVEQLIDNAFREKLLAVYGASAGA